MNKKQNGRPKRHAATLAAQREAESVENFEWRDDDFQLCGLLSHIKADEFSGAEFLAGCPHRFMRNFKEVRCFALFCIAAIALLAILGP